MISGIIYIMYTQRDPRWKNIRMGFGTVTIGNYGCYLTSLVNGMNTKGYTYTPKTLNQLLKDEKLWTGATRNYIDVSSLKFELPKIFTGFIRKEPWDDMNYLKLQLKAGAVILGKVSARGIGGSGTHFVLITGIEGKDAIIHDPWTGEHQPVKNRYSKYGNILGLRIFGVKEPVVEKKLSLNDDISSEYEEILKLKSYSWYDKHWTWKQLLQACSKAFKNKETIKTLKEGKKALEDKLEANKTYTRDLTVQSRRAVEKSIRLEEELEELRDNAADLLDYQEKMDAVELELKECREQNSHYLAQSTVADGIIIVINAIKKGRWKA